MSKAKKEVNNFLNTLRATLLSQVALPALSAAIQVAPQSIQIAEEQTKTVITDGVSKEVPLSGGEKFKMALILMGASLKATGRQLPQAVLATTLQVSFLNSPLAKLTTPEVVNESDYQQGDIPISTLGGNDETRVKEKRNTVMTVKP